MISVHHVNAIVSGKILENMVILCDGSKILRVEKDDSRWDDPERCQVIDGGGLYVSAGWMDIQINGGFGIDFTDHPDGIWDVAAQLPQYGITHFLPTIITSPLSTYDNAIRVLQNGPPEGWQGAIPIGYHFEGPFINRAKKGAHNPDYILDPSLKGIENWSRENGVLLVTLAPEIPGAAEVISVLATRDIVISAGHSMADYEQAIASFETGIDMGTHLYNAMPLLAHREPGLVGALLTQPEIYTSLIADGIHCHPAMVSMAWHSKGNDRLILVTDAMAALGMPPGNYLLGDYKVIVNGMTAKLENGTLAGSVLTPGAAIHNVMKYAGCSINEAVLCVTRNPANLLGFTNKGDIYPGADADLTLFTSEGKVVATIVGGNMAFSGL